MNPITSILPCPWQPNAAGLHPGEWELCLSWDHLTSSLPPLTVQPHSALWMNPTYTLLNAEGAVQDAAVAIPSETGKTTFHFIRPHSLQPWAWGTLGNICRLRLEERAAGATTLTTLIRSLRITHQASFWDQSMQAEEVEQSLSHYQSSLLSD